MQHHRTILPNGLRVIAVPMPYAASVTVLVLVRAGTEYEEKRLNGIAHFLEHLYFKGTTRRPSALSISREIEGLGGEANAFTDREMTGYYAEAEARHFDAVLDLVADIFLHSTFPAAEIEKERTVIEQEIARDSDLPEVVAMEAFDACLYGAQPAGWPVLGTKKSIGRIGRDDFLAFEKKHYVARNTVVIVAGNVDEDVARNAVATAFSEARGGEAAAKPPLVEEQDTPEILLKKRKTFQAHLVFGVRAYDGFNPRLPALRVLGSVLGGGMSSRLFQRIREEMGAAYYTFAKSQTYADHGNLFAEIGTDVGNAHAVARETVRIMKGLAESPVPHDELEVAKNFLAGRLVIGNETPERIAGFYGSREVIGLPQKTPAELAAEIRAVTAREVEETAREIFMNDRLNCVVVGAIPDPDGFKRLVAF